MATKRIIVERRTKKRLSGEQVLAQLRKCCDTAMKSGRGSGWSYQIERQKIPFRDDRADVLVHQVTIRFDQIHNRESVGAKWPKIVQRFAEAACAGQLKANPWRVTTPTGYADLADKAIGEATKSANLRVMADEPKELGTVNLEPKDNFVRVYNRMPQINRVMDALRLAQRTNWVKRTHTLFDGPPGCGKSEIMLGLRSMLGEENRAWRWMDATSMTKAGAIEEIIESSVVPPVLFLEEIEKCEEAALRWLLGVMDTRGEIRRTNYRVGNQAKNVRMVVIASANNVKLLRGLMSGALYSRFQNKVYCPRPDREVMKLILQREITEISGDPAWIEPAIRFGYDKWGMTDPRELIQICSCGAERLMNGSYQRDFEATMHPTEKRALLKAKKRVEEEAAKKSGLAV